MLSRRNSILLAASTVVVVAGVSIALLAPGSHQPRSLPVVASSVPPSVSAQAAAPATTTAKVVPTRVIVPSIGVNAPVMQLGLCPTTRPDEDCSGVQSGGLATPLLNAQNLAGWWSGGYAPGQDGPAVIVGHVNSAQAGNLVFANLDKLAAGAAIEITPGNLWFTVVGTQEVGKGNFPTQQVYGKTPGPTLRLVTCGGSFDAATGHYQDNFIVYAVLAHPSG
ncbi:MAG: sortase domain-containing protein [Streptosporangiaceae bacterium]